MEGEKKEKRVKKSSRHHEDGEKKEKREKKHKDGSSLKDSKVKRTRAPKSAGPSIPEDTELDRLFEQFLVEDRYFVIQHA